MLPVVRRRADGTLAPHVRLSTGTLGDPAQKRPAIADNPCDCKCDNTPGPHGPYPNCAACITDIKGIKVEASGYVSHICDETFYDTFGRYIGTSHYECLGGNLNGSFSLTTLESTGTNGKQFSLTFAPPGSCAGLLAGTHQFTASNGSICTTQYYVQKLWGGVGCLGSSMCFGLSLQEGHRCFPQGTNCAPDEPAAFWTSFGCMATASVDQACNVGAASLYQFDQNCLNRGIPQPPRTSTCVFPPYTVTYKFRPIW